MSVKVEVSYGELLDKISILEIKRANASARRQRRNIETELAALFEARDRAIPGGAPIGDLYHSWAESMGLVAAEWLH